jgi:2-amino-4-hydroxy-6-hydroxymethyldihydropteridine diphosphokinase
LNAAAKTPKHRVILGLGSNINSSENIVRALKLLNQQIGVQRVSSTWESRAVGSDGPDFLNAAAWVETPLNRIELKQHILRKIEADLGRVRTADKNAPRTIDIDILIFDENFVEPEVWEHAFLAIPAAELLPDFKHPKTGESIQNAARRLALASRLEHRPEVVPGMWSPVKSSG